MIEAQNYPYYHCYYLKESSFPSEMIINLFTQPSNPFECTTPEASIYNNDEGSEGDDDGGCTDNNNDEMNDDD